MSEVVVINVSEEFNDQRLDVFLTHYLEIIPSRSFASKVIENKYVTVDDKHQKSSYKLKTLQKISINTSFMKANSSEPVGEKIPLDILYEDESLIIINKPAGMVVHPGAGVHSGTLVNAILAHCGGSSLPSLGTPSRAGIVHRLDRDTSGVMVVAKSQLALTKLSKQFADHSHTRIYHAIVYGSVAPLQGKIDTWHGRDSKNRIRYATQPEGIGKRAIMNFSSIQNLYKNLFTLVSCELFTGRTHQIRVQMNSIGHSLVGDALYSSIPGVIKNNKELYAFLKNNIHRQMLHALSLGIKHPVTNEQMTFSVPYPNDFQSVFDFLNSKEH